MLSAFWKAFDIHQLSLEPERRDRFSRSANDPAVRVFHTFRMLAVLWGFQYATGSLGCPSVGRRPCAMLPVRSSPQNHPLLKLRFLLNRNFFHPKLFLTASISMLYIFK